MKTNPPGKISQFHRGLVLCVALVVAVAARAQDIGVGQLRALDPTLTGTGVWVAQPEAIEANPDHFEVNPAAVGQPASLFTYMSSSGTAAGTYPNAIGTESLHADQVGDRFYGKVNTGTPEGVAYGVSHVDNYDANFFVINLIGTGTPIPARVVNQSFIFPGAPIPVVDQAYDDYVAAYNTIFVSGVGNSGSPSSPSTAYNSIAVGAYSGSSSVGPTTGGRSKPDITAPATATSFSTPQVAGAAAILVEAGARADGGSGTVADATDARTVKALLLNGATKQAGWTHTSAAPLDTVQGAGVLNIYNSYLQLAGGEHTFTASTTSQTPPVVSGSVSSLAGWNFASLASSATNDAVEHYFFDLSAGQASAFTLTSTLVWERQFGETAINNLQLYLYTAAGALVDSSVSSVDNVEYLYTQNLAPGRYDLEVDKVGGTIGSAGVVSNAEDYALTFNFAPVPEPSSWALLLCGLGSFAAVRRRFRRRD